MEKSRAGQVHTETPVVLFIEDDEATQIVLRSFCSILGWTAYIADNGQTGIELCRQHADELSIVLLDKSLPDMDGIDVLAAVRAIRPNIPALFVTGWDPYSVMHQVRSYDNVGVVQKPYSMRELMNTMQDMLEHPSEATKSSTH